MTDERIGIPPELQSPVLRHMTVSRHRGLVIPAVAAACFWLLMPSGCSGTNCAAVYTPGLIVTVDSSSGVPICGATVVVANDSNTIRFEPTARGQNTVGCNVYGGVLKGPGKYTVTVTAGSRTVTVPGVSVRTNSCGFITQRVAVTIPSSSSATK